MFLNNKKLNVLKSSIVALLLSQAPNALAAFDLSGPSSDSDGAFTLTVTNLTGNYYAAQIQRRPVGGSWSLIHSVYLPSGGRTYTEDLTGENGDFEYRARGTNPCGAPTCYTAWGPIKTVSIGSNPVFKQASGRVRASADNDILEVGGDEVYIKFTQSTDALGLANGDNSSSLEAESSLSVDLGVGPARLQIVEVVAEGTLEERNGTATASAKETAFRYKDDTLAIDTASSVSDTRASISRSLSREFISGNGELFIRDYTPGAIDRLVGNSRVQYAGGVSGLFRAENSVVHSSRTSGANRVNDIEANLSLEANLTGSLFGAFRSGDVDITFDLNDATLLSGNVRQVALVRSTKHSNTDGRTMLADADGSSNLVSPKVEALLEGSIETGLGDLEVEEEITLWNAFTHNNRTIFDERDEDAFGNVTPPINIVPFSTLSTVDRAPCAALKLPAQVSTPDNNYNEQVLCRSTHRIFASNPVRFGISAGDGRFHATHTFDVSSSEPAATTPHLFSIHHDQYWATSVSVGNNLAPGARIQIQAKVYSRCGSSQFSNWSEVYTTVENARVFALDARNLMSRVGGSRTLCLTDDLIPENRIMYRVRYETDNQTGPWAYLRPVLMRRD